MRIFIYLMLAAAVSLAGCVGSASVPVNHYTTQLIEPGMSMRTLCPVAPPPTKAAYLAVDHDTREGMMTDAYNAQTANIGECNQKISRLNTWYVQQEKALAPSAAGAPVGK